MGLYSSHTLDLFFLSREAPSEAAPTFMSSLSCPSK
uniref:Uncharacterized protein n=1 Tax=Arundo donax TaxID=35708 RepID=A0A0A9G7N2_ARUDO